MELTTKISAEKSTYAGRKGVLLQNKECALFVQNIGGMTPLFALKQGKDLINSVWTPHFRGSPGHKFSYDNPADVDYWGHNILFEACGTFPCVPTFGGGDGLEPADSPPHGHTANLEWDLSKTHTTADYSYAKWEMDAPKPWQLKYTKYDILDAHNPTHTLLIEVENTGDSKQKINLAWHTTIGEPLLCDNGLLSCSSDQYAIPPLGSEFDDTGNYKRGAKFNSLKKVPLENPVEDNSFEDLSNYKLHTGYAHLISAQMPKTDMGWASFINPHLKAGFLTISPPPILDHMLSPNFCNFWTQRGGRYFTPWANEKNGPDHSKALGMEMSIGYFANGLKESLEHPNFLERDTYVTLEPKQKVRFCVINLMFTPEFLGAVQNIELQDQGINVISSNTNNNISQNIACDVNLKYLKEILD